MHRHFDVVGVIHLDFKTVERDDMVDESPNNHETKRDCFGELLNFQDVAGNEDFIGYLGKKEGRTCSCLRKNKELAKTRIV